MSGMHGFSAEEMRKAYKIEFDRRGKISQFGGVKPFVEFLKKGQFKERLQKQFGEQKTRAMLQFLVGIIAGAETMEEVERIGRDPLFKQYLEYPVGATQLTRIFKLFSAAEIAELHELILSFALINIVENVKKEEALIFDVDATAVEKYGEQEGVETGYVDKNAIRDCYQYLFFRLENLNTFLYGTIRGGSAHSQNGFGEYLDRFLPIFGGSWHIKIRADSGFFSEEVFDKGVDYNATFYIKAPMPESRIAQGGSSRLTWFASSTEKGIEYASYTTRTERGSTWREVFKRKLSETNAPTLFPVYDYQCIATNDLSSKEEEVYAFYNGRAKIENNIRELKYDYTLGKIVTSSFDVNDVITQTTMLAYILMAHFKHRFLDKRYRKCRLSTLRWRVFNIPARLLSSGHQLSMRIWNVFCDEMAYLRTLWRIENIRTFILHPPS